MAVSDVFTQHLLNRWPVIMQESPWHFNQITGEGDYAPLSQDCDQVYIQAERDQIANALVAALRQVGGYLGYDPTPVWRTERLTFGIGEPFRAQILALERGYVQAFGRRATSLIDADAGVDYSDSDGDGVNDLGTITVSTDVIDADEIKVFFRVADGAPGAADARWEIEPAVVTVNAGTATIRVRRWLLVHPTVVWAKPYSAPNYSEKEPGDTGDAADFVTAVDVYRVYNDPTGAITFNYRPGAACGSFAYTTASGDGLLANGEVGLISLRAALDACPVGPLASADVSYLAGLPLVNGMMDRELEEMLIRLANTKIAQQPGCFCDRTLTMWQRDLMPVPPERLQQRLVNNPFGIMEGEINAWRIIEARALGRGGRAF